jgi:hypothetical protein
VFAGAAKATDKDEEPADEIDEHESNIMSQTLTN